MEIEYDPEKDAINIEKHGISLVRMVDLQPTIVVSDADRFSEPRYRVYGLIGGKLHCAARPCA